VDSSRIVYFRVVVLYRYEYLAHSLITGEEYHKYYKSHQNYTLQNHLILQTNITDDIQQRSAYSHTHVEITRNMSIEPRIEPSVHIILGCMYSGKSTELRRRISRYEAVDIETLTVTSTLDTRGGKRPANRVNFLRELLDTPELRAAKVVGIDEAQFFPDLLDFVREMEHKKTLIIAGLDGDSNREPFGQILLCIPLCDSVVKLTALDQNGSEAIFTYRKTEDSDQIHTVNSDYIPVSRKSWKKLKAL